VDPSARVCPYCGNPPGGVFCAACGRNLAAVERLPTREQWARGEPAAAAPDHRLADRCAEATTAFLAAMRAAGNPGVQRFTTPRPSPLRRTGRIEGWILWPVDREDFDGPRRYEPGLVLTVDGHFHRLDNELRGWGQRNFPYYEHTASREPIEMPAEERLLDALAAARTAYGLA
jgi:hypothetical protein